MSQCMSENASVVCPVHLFFLCLSWTRHLTGGTLLSCKNVSHIRQAAECARKNAERMFQYMPEILSWWAPLEVK